MGVELFSQVQVNLEDKILAPFELYHYRTIWMLMTSEQND